MLAYLRLAPCAFLHCSPGQSCTRSKRPEGSSKDVANSKGYELLQPERESQLSYQHHDLLLPGCCKCFCIDTDLISIYGVIVLYGVDFCHREGHSKTHYSHRKCFNCRLLEDVQVWSHRRLIPEMVQVRAVRLMFSTESLSRTTIPHTTRFIEVVGCRLKEGSSQRVFYGCSQKSCLFVSDLGLKGFD